MISVDQAKNILIENIQNSKTEVLGLLKSLGHVLSVDIRSEINVPSFDNSAMDGYCFQFVEGQSTYKIQSQIQAGDTDLDDILPGNCARIYTGAMMPKGADTVVQQELVSVNDGVISFDIDKLEKGLNVRLEGAQNKIGEVIVSRGTKITPSVIGLLASIGIPQVQVFKKPSVGIVITGNELIEVGEFLEKGKIYNSNEYALCALLQSIGIEQIECFKASDSLESVIDALNHARAKNDFVLVTGGISVGDFDFVNRAMSIIGVKELFYKVRQKPGKPLWVGKIQDQWFFALPGNPAAVITCFNQYVKPTILNLSGHSNSFEPLAQLPLQNSVSKKAGLTHFLKGYYTMDSVRILKSQESFNMKSFNAANCIVEIPENAEQLSENTLVYVYPLPN